MPRRSTFRDHVGLGGGRSSTLMPQTFEEKMDLATEIDEATDAVTQPFKTKFDPLDMRQLALVAHNHMKPAMKEFIMTYSEVLKKFRITGTNTTMRMCKSLWGEDNPEVEYGLACTSGPLGGDAQIAALMCVEDLGAMIFFIDPLSAHPHQADIDSLQRLANCGNVIVCCNPTSAMSMMHTLKCALEKGSRGMIPSFFETLESPAVSEYKYQQELALASAVNSGNGRPMLMNEITQRFDSTADSDEESEEEEEGDVLDRMEEHQSKVTFPSSNGDAPAAAPAQSPQSPKTTGRESLTRGSTLTGIAPPKKKRGIFRKIGKSMKKMQM